MLNFDPQLELRIIKTLIDKRKTDWLSVLNRDWFGQPACREIYIRLATLRAHGKQIPSGLTLSTDPVLSEASQALLQGDVPAFEETEYDQAFESLNALRQGRVLLGMAQEVAKILTPADATIAPAKEAVQQALAQLGSADFQDDILSYGRENEKTLELYEAMLATAATDRFIPTGFRNIDEQQGGLARGRIYAIGAPSGGGKSILANQIAINAYRAGHSGIYGSFELGREECLMRTQANITKIPHDRFQLQKLSPEERIRSDKALARFLTLGAKSQKPLEYLCPNREDISIVDFFTMIEPLSFDFFIVDYLNLMKPVNPKEQLWWNLGEGFRLAKKFAQRTNTVGLMLVQIDEDTGDLKYAKSIKHHSDGVWTWRYSDADREAGTPVEIQQIKLRNFKPSKFYLQPEFEYCAFTESLGHGAPTRSVLGPQVPPPMKLS
jgi:hypothetical protein